ncbi:MAG: hypothetical protein K0Q69_969 [Devosia sp.]|nr:hypothetical protein [Devosia sp.]
MRRLVNGEARRLSAHRRHSRAGGKRRAIRRLYHRYFLTHGVTPAQAGAHPEVFPAAPGGVVKSQDGSRPSPG